MSFSYPATVREPLSTAPQGSIFATSGPNVPPQGIQIVSKPICTTRILLLSGFAPELKTHHLISVFAEWEDQNGGFRVKWIDDRSAYIVFQDAITAKKAFLATVSNLPSSLAASSHQEAALLTPYTGPEAEGILASVANRPRSKSNAGMQGGSLHNRRASNPSVIGLPPVSENGTSGGGRRESFASSANNRSGFMNGLANGDFAQNARAASQSSAVLE